ncbi:MAG: hypothetical protein QNK37_16165 [Acidobacteriota bacterium]|nr:hypothetical protein [Acidobacteriota bacterium]
MKPMLVLLMLCAPLCRAASEITLDGLPLQMAWGDIDGNGHKDLVALMILTQTEGQVTTYFEGETLRGMYRDETVVEKYLVTVLNNGDKWEATWRLKLGRENIPGFALQEAPDAQLLLWRGNALVRHKWENGQWDPKQRFKTPGLLATTGVSMKDFSFWHRTAAGDYWFVPDLDGMHFIHAGGEGMPQFVEYPELAVDGNTTRGNSWEREGDHQVRLNMPQFLSVDRDKGAEMVFQGNERAMGWRLGETQPTFDGVAKGTLVDLNGDGMADLIQAEEEGEVDKLRDLPKMKTRIRTFLATSPLNFPAQPNHEQVVPGMVLTENDSDIELAEPFLDINSDGRADLVGIAVKLTMFRVIRAVATGRLRIKFLMHLTLQEDDGSFRTLAGGPFEMTWKLNIRRLKMPHLAQLAADFDGDGWMDIMLEKGNRLEVTPVTRNGLQNTRLWKQKIPNKLRDPDQVFGRDLNGDKKAEFIFLKTGGGKTTIAALEAQP